MKEKILNKAVDLFINYGFKSITMDDIAKEMAISKKTIYKYFKNKVELVEASVIHFHKSIEATINEIIQKDYNAIEENFVIKNVFINMFKKSKASPMFQLKKYYPKTHRKLMEHEICTFKDCVMENLKKGISEKLYRSNIDKDMVIKLYFTLVFEAYEGDLFGNNMEDIMKTELKILEYHTRSIATNEGIKLLDDQLSKLK